MSRRRDRRAQQASVILMSLAVTTGFLGVAYLLTVAVLVMRYKLYARYGVWWVCMGALFSVIGFYPDLSDTLAHALGVSYAPNLVFTVALLLLLGKGLCTDVTLSRKELQLRRLTQIVALLENEVSCLQQKTAASKNDTTE